MVVVVFKIKIVYFEWVGNLSHLHQLDNLIHHHTYNDMVFESGIYKQSLYMKASYNCQDVITGKWKLKKRKF